MCGRYLPGTFRRSLGQRSTQSPGPCVGQSLQVLCRVPILLLPLDVSDSVTLNVLAFDNDSLRKGSVVFLLLLPCTEIGEWSTSDTNNFFSVQSGETLDVDHSLTSTGAPRPLERILTWRGVGFGQRARTTTEVLCAKVKIGVVR